MDIKQTSQKDKQESVTKVERVQCGGYHRKFKNGCRFYHDCFTCPLPDCIAPSVDLR